MLCYSYIWYYIWKNRGHSLNQKEFSTTMTLFMICFCYFIFVMPITICHILQDLGGHQSNPMVYLAVYCLYWFQYSFNFFIYAFRSGQYRKAYKFFLIEVCLYLSTWHILSKMFTNNYFYRWKIIFVEIHFHLIISIVKKFIIQINENLLIWRGIN